MRLHVRGEGGRVASLHEHSTGACEVLLSRLSRKRDNGKLSLCAPVNLHTRPSPALIVLMMPPLAIRSSTYLQFHATRCPLSMMYFSPSRSCSLQCQPAMHVAPWAFPREGARLTSFRMMAPMLCIQQRPTPPILYVNKPSPENMALLILCAL